jgi:hypothetical protein
VPLQADTRVLIFTLIAALSSTIIFGLLPAVQATRGDVISATSGEFSHYWRAARLRNVLVVAQIAICVLSLISSGVLIRGAKALRGFDVGYATDGVIVVRVDDTHKARVLEVLSSESVVQRIAAASSTPMNGMLPTLGLTNKAGGTEHRAWYNEVSPEYFASLGIPILQGRGFTTEEGTTRAPVVIVSNAEGSVASDPATLTIGPPLTSGGKPPIVTFTNLLQNLVRPGDSTRSTTLTEYALRPNETLTISAAVRVAEPAEARSLQDRDQARRLCKRVTRGGWS